MNVGFWNVRGWNCNNDSDNLVLRSSCIFNTDCDIIGVAETHLLNDNDTILTWFGFNRDNIHKNSRTGSRGVGLSVKNIIRNEFSISVLNCSFEGLVWFKSCHKSDNCVLLPCVCYLPPYNSSRRIDVNMFYDNLNWYLQKSECIYMWRL